MYLLSSPLSVGHGQKLRSPDQKQLDQMPPWHASTPSRSELACLLGRILYLAQDCILLPLCRGIIRVNCQRGGRRPLLAGTLCQTINLVAR